MATSGERPGPDIDHVREAMREHDRDNPTVPVHHDRSRPREVTEEEGSDGGTVAADLEGP